MTQSAPLSSEIRGDRPQIGAVIELLKPITWFAAMWAFGCGVVSAGMPWADVWTAALLGALLAGPMVCGMSQAVNDWFDRHVDAINEPHRPIPSGRIPGQWGLAIAIIWTGLSLVVAAQLGVWVLGATVVACALAWAYSAPPFRLKKNGWYGNAAVGFSYEGIAWVTGAAAVIGGMPSAEIIALAVLYSIGAHGIMTLNDFKSVDGDRALGLQSLPVQLGVGRAAQLACIVMAVPQIIVIGLLLSWGTPVHAALVFALLAAQVWLMARTLLDEQVLVEKPVEKAAFYNGTGTTLYVLGMLVSAFAIRSLTMGATP
ncbi:MAG: chlorophyll synthase ChlG [Pseudomonadota bacterium]